MCREDVCNALREYENERLARVKIVSKKQADQVNKMYSYTVNNVGVAISNSKKELIDEETKEIEAKEQKQYLEWLFKGV